ncbi:glycosyltransferase [Planctomonas deserti]|uniref:glycosyltransferase n=1 Tax=Planctomonas deserti TaxID=2144185 RepID=UPI00131F2DCB|nr:glycosyltransferase [Planctomonas deserti]
MRVCIVAAPLTARSGVFMSARELVAAARARGLDWSAVLGLRPAIHDASPDADVSHVLIDRHGAECIAQVQRDVLSMPQVADADVVITMIAQSDIAMSRTRRPGVLWVPFVRGLPWPDRGEAKPHTRAVKWAAERYALRRAGEVWATTPVLARQIRSARKAVLVPAGVSPLERRVYGTEEGLDVVWAGRLDVDKDPGLFLDVMRDVPGRARVYGRGPLEQSLRDAAPDNVELAGWSDSASIWRSGTVFAGTSRREAFGRSAVEAAFCGLPVVITEDYGCAPLLYRDADLARRFVLPRGDRTAWRTALTSLAEDRGLRSAASDHVNANAQSLTIDRSVDRILENITRLRQAGEKAGR